MTISKLGIVTYRSYRSTYDKEQAIQSKWPIKPNCWTRNWLVLGENGIKGQGLRITKPTKKNICTLRLLETLNSEAFGPIIHWLSYTLTIKWEFQ